MALVLVVLLLGHVPSLFLPFWTLRYAIVVGALPAGWVALSLLARRGDRAAWFAIAFVLVAVVAALRSPAPRMSFLGYWGTGTSLILYAGVLGLWAIGRLATDRLRALTPVILAVALGMNVLLGLAQILLDVERGPFGTISGRASGFLTNAVYFGALTAGFAAWCTAAAARSGWHGYAAGAAIFGFGAGLSGSRIAAIALFVIAVIIVVGYRSVRATLGAAASIAGLLIAALLTAATASTSTVERLASYGGDGRTDLWGFAYAAFQDRPILGWGLGNHTTATRPHYTLDYTRQYASNEALHVWSDPHNVVLHLLVATGAAGLLCIVGFVVVQLGRVRCIPALAMVGVVAITWLAEPVHITTLPVMMLVLGIAIEGPRRPTMNGLRWKRVAMTATGLGVALVMFVLLADIRFARALDDGDVAEMELMTTWLLDDPRLTALVSEQWVLRWSADDRFAAEALQWTRLAAERDPANGFRWAELARRQLGMGLNDESLSTLDRAFELHPWSPTAWQVRFAHATITGDVEAARHAGEVVCALQLPLCPDPPVVNAASEGVTHG